MQAWNQWRSQGPATLGHWPGSLASCPLGLKAQYGGKDASLRLRLQSVTQRRNASARGQGSGGGRTVPRRHYSMAGEVEATLYAPTTTPIGSQQLRLPVVGVRRGRASDWRQPRTRHKCRLLPCCQSSACCIGQQKLQMAERRLSQPGMRRFLVVDRRNCPDVGGSNEPERHPNIEGPREAPVHPESEPNMENFTSNLRELIDFLKDNNEEVRDAYDRGGLNCKMTSPDIQKDLARCCAEEITEAIMEEIGNRPFSVLIDESRDIVAYP
ncbi:uncharacterized protein LOC110434530 isoform X3 [Sorghum bicolor]|uniref:uncharacterized protein LOC110434530 isoform X3 n=1 Tax=Sorghum bicolor TaxID=4558 RepID=UPI000B4257AF|nr:uncharacterized protein LOC110434530 isoform X3 [Sorghum bicolor]|eukprot:XP_021314374.1 uncharacterized protein LOC110434530 isoform X3 [Sorghum bicolor]